MDLSRAFARQFPVPQLLLPHAAGIDITDASVKWMTLRPGKHGTRIVAFGNEPLAPGIVQNGAIRDTRALSDALRGIKKRLGGVTHAHAALPEEGAFVFNMLIPAGSSRAEILPMIEFELEGRVPIPVPQTVFDYDLIAAQRDSQEVEIGVVVFPKEIAEGYAAAFEGAGITLLSLEIEARSIARAVSDVHGNEPITLLVDAGKSRTGFAIVKRGIPIFTSTVEVGGEQMTKVVMEKLSLSEADAQLFKNNQGLAPTDEKGSAVKADLEKVAAVLAEEVERHYHFWDTRRNEHGERVTPVERILLVGGCANLRGLTDFIASKVHAPTERPNVWRNVCSFDEQIPEIDRRTSLQFATAVGLALRDILV